MNEPKVRYLRSIIPYEGVKLDFYRVEGFPWARNAYLSIDFFYEDKFCIGLLLDPCDNFRIKGFGWKEEK